MVGICQYTFVQTYTMYNDTMNGDTNYRLWVIMRCQCRFINSNECTMLVGILGERINQMLENISGPFPADITGMSYYF